MIDRLVLASGNRGKLREFSALFSEQSIEVLAQSAYDTPEIEETGLSFVENAILKARNACRHSGLPALADDSGLEVDALQGAPGIHSARFAGLGASDEDNYQQLLTQLQGVPSEDRHARFQCVLVYMRHEHDPTPQVFQGAWQGCILEQACGAKGFGYDPVFFVPDMGCSAAELTKAQKNARSHRGQAMAALLAGWRP